MPLEWCFKPGVKLDFRDRPDGYVCTPADVEAELARIGHAVEPLDIVLVNTRAGSRYGHDDFVNAGCGMGRDATIYLLERGVRVTGIDAWSCSGKDTRRAARSVTATSKNCTTSESLPGHGFTVCCFPAKIRGASAGWTRAVAIFNS